ncbi:MAG: T9SS type A sorting domain-containing protein, partial [Saprospiraceae bacterium]|nr:T9SS type A sorting domain-containing protein [Saprospiraceae bacterium]
GGSTAWDAGKYCNIWVVAMSDGLAGYAQMPGGPEATDGIVINEQFFARAARVSIGDTITMGRTLVHLMGSYLNLYELWSEDVPCMDDYVEDTPVHNAPNGGMIHYRHVSLCGENPVEMTMNLMDATHENNQYMFTRGQVWRMQATLAKKGFRGQLGHTPTPCSSAADMAMAKGSVKSEGSDNQGLKLQVFPNPARGKFTVEIHSEQTTTAEIRIFDVLGKPLYGQSVQLPGGSVRHEISTDRWSAGTYMVSVVSNDQYLTQKIFVEK